MRSRYILDIRTKLIYIFIQKEKKSILERSRCILDIRKYFSLTKNQKEIFYQNKKEKKYRKNSTGENREKKVQSHREIRQ